MGCRQPIHALATGASQQAEDRGLIGAEESNQGRGIVLQHDANTAKRFSPMSFMLLCFQEAAAMPDPGRNEQSLELPEVLPSPPLTVARAPAPPVLASISDSRLKAESVLR